MRSGPFEGPATVKPPALPEDRYLVSVAKRPLTERPGPSGLKLTIERVSRQKLINRFHKYRSVFQPVREARVGSDWARPAEARFSFVIYHLPFDDLKLAEFIDKWQMTSEK